MNQASVAMAARIVLATALAFSGFAKLRARAAVREQVATLVSERAAPIVAPLLPAAELVVSLGLIAWWNLVPGVVALALLTLFTVVLVRAQARRVPCLCFGSSTVDTPVGPAAIVRNGVLGALAVLAIGSPSGASGAATLVIGVVFAAVAGQAVHVAG